jgi:hypothetical protein
MKEVILAIFSIISSLFLVLVLVCLGEIAALSLFYCFTHTNMDTCLLILSRGAQNAPIEYEGIPHVNNT